MEVDNTINQAISAFFHSLSFIFCLVISIIYWRKKNIHSFPLDLAISLCLSCSFSHLFSIPLIFSKKLQLESFILFFNVIGVSLAGILAFTILYNYTYINYIHNHKRRFIYAYASVVCIISLPILILHSVFQPTGNKKMSNAIIYAYVVILWTSLLLNTLLILIIGLRIKRQFGFKAYRIKLILYALIPILVYIPETINIYISIDSLQSYYYWFFFLVLITNGFKGLIFTLVYGINFDVIGGIKSSSPGLQLNDSYAKILYDEPSFSVRYSDAYND